jgi:hypothetical protein
MRWGPVVFAATVALGGCGDGGEPEETPTTRSTREVTTTTITEAAPSTTLAREAAASAQATATLLFEAWKMGDRSTALSVASEEAVDALFRSKVSRPAPEFEGCDRVGTGQHDCAYRYEGGGIVMRVSGGRVERVEFIAD